MTNEYLYGTYGIIGETVAQNAVQAGTVLAYIGTAPVNLVRGYKDLKIVNYPVKLSNIGEAERKLGYSSDWESFTLCEVFTAHFDNAIGNIGPVYVVNILDPDTHKTDAITKTLKFTGGRAEFKGNKIILDSIVLEDLVEGVDYSIEYNFAKEKTSIKSLDPDNPISGDVLMTYNEVDSGSIEYEDIIGRVTEEGDYSGIGVIQLFYQEQNIVPNIIAAPGWSGIPAVYNAMISASKKINGQWDAFVNADIPLTSENTRVDTISKAKEWKNNNGYTSERSKAYWPKGVDNFGRNYHLSTLASVEMLRTDLKHNSVPMETPGNKQIPIARQYFGPESKNNGFDKQTAKELTSNGITTTVASEGAWVLWGDHTAAYTFGGDVDPRAIFDLSIRMLLHISNSFQREWGAVIDKPMDRQLVDTILNREQEKLDTLASMGALLGKPSALFLESENSTTDLMNGNFRWDIPVTPTPPFKSGTVYVAYTDAGFKYFFEGGAA